MIHGLDRFWFETPRFLILRVALASILRLPGLALADPCGGAESPSGDDRAGRLTLPVTR